MNNEYIDKVEVKLISKPENMLKTLYTACRTCYSNKSPVEIYNEIEDNKDKMLNLITKVIASGHYSTIEHIQISYAISGISRACSHQLVRHRHMSFSQKSQRYVEEKGQFKYIIPKTIEKNEQLLKKFNSFMETTSKFYREMVEFGIKPEDARSILPNATSTSMIASLNLRELIHLCHLRLCTRAQDEIREMTQQMVNCLIEVEPWLNPYLVPKCEKLGFCDEHKSCGRKPTLNKQE